MTVFFFCFVIAGFSAVVFVLKPAFAFEAEQQISEAPEGEPWDALCAGVRGH